MQPENKDALRKEYAECWRSISAGTSALKRIIKALLDEQAAWADLVLWAVEAGARENHVRKLLSEILLEMGVRRRRRGAGPATPQEALLIVAYVRSRYGHRTLKFLRAAARAAKLQDEAQAAEAQSA